MAAPADSSARCWAYGCFLGAAVGDAAGAPLEMMGRAPTESEARLALCLRGGGVHDTGPGQVTDDTEMAICLARGLVRANIVDRSLSSPLVAFSSDAIALFYAHWSVRGDIGVGCLTHSFRSYFDELHPFDVGITCGTAIRGCRRLVGSRAGAAIGPHPPEALMPRSQCLASAADPQPFAEAMRAAAAFENQGSKSNGSLMRCTPLAVWGHRLVATPAGVDVLAAAAWNDAALTHPSFAVKASTAAYVLAAAHLIHSGSTGVTTGRAAAAVHCAEQWLSRQAAAPATDDARRKGIAEVQEWLQLARANNDYPYHPHAGFSKIGFIHAFRHLLLETPYAFAIQETGLGGGDTDTNMAIVGGLVGALHGAELAGLQGDHPAVFEDIPRIGNRTSPVRAVPSSMISAVMCFRAPSVSSAAARAGRPRPRFLSHEDFQALVDQLVDGAPDSLVNAPPLL